MTVPLRFLSIAWLVEAATWSIPWLFSVRSHDWGWVMHTMPLPSVRWIVSYHAVMALGSPLVVVLLWTRRVFAGCLALICLASAGLLMEMLLFRGDALQLTLPIDLLSMLTLGVVAWRGIHEAAA